MDLEEIKALVTITLEKEFDDQKNNISTYALREIEGKRVILYEHADTLVDIFSNIQSDESTKSEFLKLLITAVENSPDFEIDMHGSRQDIYASKSSLCFYTLIKLGFVNEAFIALENRSKQQVSGSLFSLMIYVLNEDYAYFDLKEISRLIEITKKLISGGRYYADRYKENALSILRTSAYEIAKKSIKGVNIEINRDKKEVESIIKYLEFDDKYNKLLNDIDSFINTESEVLSSGMISNLRSFMEDLLTDLAKRIASLEDAEIPKYEGLGEMGCIRRYLKIKLELSDNDNNLINKYIDVLHSEGGHSFVSNKDYFRLARNIGIEIVLLLLSKYKSKYIS